MNRYWLILQLRSGQQIIPESVDKTCGSDWFVKKYTWLDVGLVLDRGHILWGGT